MKKLIAALLLGSAFLTANAADTLQQDLQQIWAGLDRTTNAGMIVSDPKTGNILFARRADYLFTPASVQKLFTASAAIIELGANFQFRTQLLSTAKISGGVLLGDLSVKFSGDPSLKSAQLLALIERLQSVGVKEIKGNIRIDNSDYNDIPYPPGWMWEDLSYGYAAPLNAVILDRNKFILHFVPGVVGQHPKLQPDLPEGVLNFENNLMTTSQYHDYCPITIYSDYKNQYRINGCLDKQWGEQRRTLAIRNPVPLAEALISQALEKSGVKFNGKFVIEKAESGSRVLAEHTSEPLTMIVKEMLKKSDNLTTDTLLKKVGQHFFKQQGNWQNGLRALKKILGPRTGINFEKNLINDGAGLSRYNLLSPQQLVKLLNYDYKNNEVRRVLFKTLPVGGIDGTLKGRMRGNDIRGRVHAKTGSMTGVTALAGYVETRHNGVVTFAILVNGFVGKDYAYDRLQDKTCIVLANYKGRRNG